MSYTMGTFNTLMKCLDDSDSVEKPNTVATTQADMSIMQKEHLASLSPEALIELKKKHGIR